ncbi:MAG: hypothetical protein WC637_08070 [Victivallales bacterium]
MNIKKGFIVKRILIMSCFLALLLSCMETDGNPIDFTSGTPVFASPSANSEILTVTSSDITMDSVEGKLVYLEKNPAVARQWHPLMVYAYFHRVKLPDGRSAWASDDLQYDTVNKMILPKTVPQLIWAVPFMVSISLLMILIYFAYRAGYLSLIAKSAVFNEAKPAIMFVLIFLLLRYALMFAIICMCGKTMVYPTDEHGYFKLSYDIIHGNFDGPWKYTVGLSLFYIPLILLTNATTYFDIADQMTFINAFILSPATLVLAFLIIRKITVSFRKAFFTSLLLAFLPFCYFPAEFFSHDGLGGEVFKSVFAMPNMNVVSYRLYYIFFNTGYNGMSDTPSMFLIFLCIYLAVSRPFGRRILVAVSLLFGISCLVRINNIFFSPLMAYVLWCGFREKIFSRREIAVHVFTALAVFILVFSPQLMINKLQFGSFTTFPYILHGNQSHRGFDLACLPGGIAYMIGCNYVYFTFCAVGLFFIRNARIKTIFALWAIPLVVFFCGYPVAGASPVRFIMPAYAALIASFACMDLWGEDSGKSKYLLMLAVSASVLLLSPCFRFECPYPFDMEGFSFGRDLNFMLNICMPLSLFALSLYFLKNSLRIFLFLTLFLVVFYSGSTYLLFSILLFHLIVSVSHCCRYRPVR